MMIPRRAVFPASLPIVVAVVSMVTVAFAAAVLTGKTAPELRASASQIGEAPVAVIAYIPDSISNGTRSWSLNGVGSYDPDGTIEAYLWVVEHDESVEYLYRALEPYPFESTGLYKIALTVTDNDNNTGTAFTAVYSFSDSDEDNIPDWWEVEYLHTLSFAAEDDPDEDGYSNLEEYARGSDPLVADSREDFLGQHWRELTAAIGVIAVTSILVYFRQRRKRKEEQRRKIEYAIEIQRALDEE